MLKKKVVNDIRQILTKQNNRDPKAALATTFEISYILIKNKLPKPSLAPITNKTSIVLDVIWSMIVELKKILGIEPGNSSISDMEILKKVSVDLEPTDLFEIVILTLSINNDLMPDNATKAKDGIAILIAGATRLKKDFVRYNPYTEW